MADVIQFGKKAMCLKSVRDVSLRQRKIEALKKLFQCTRCMLKCAKCGTQIESDGENDPKYLAPYPFCKDCREEYEEYRERSGGKLTTPKYYWHNDAWMRFWASWLEYQQNLDVYRQSREFLQLIQEVEDLLDK
jgi:hypothetical protein